MLVLTNTAYQSIVLLVKTLVSVLEILATVVRGDTISELATKLDHSESYLSRAVGDLVEKDSPIRNATAATTSTDSTSSHAG